MGFKSARENALVALKSGFIQHEARDDIDNKNLLSTGEVSTSEVVKMLKKCNGNQYSTSPHHADSSATVHIFKPQIKTEKNDELETWYIKLYFVAPDVWFISVHR